MCQLTVAVPKCSIFMRVLILVLALCVVGSAQANRNWYKPFPPFHIAGNLYYVGSAELASYLVVTPKGNILINNGYRANVPLIKASIKKLGYKFADIKIILISQAHSDHATASALIKDQTGAQYMVMANDVSAVETGGKTDFLYGNNPAQFYPPAKVDRVLHDGDTVKLGDTTLVAHLTPGHTKGNTTWTMQVKEQGKIFNVVIVGGTSVNPGAKLINNPNYPHISQDYQHTWHVLKSLPCDIFLGAHGMYFGLLQKYADRKQAGHNPFVDPDGYKAFIKQSEYAFQTELKRQQGIK